MPKSPCSKPGCRDRDKTKCADDCPELKAYQEYLDKVHDAVPLPAIDYCETWRFTTASTNKQSF